MSMRDIAVAFPSPGTIRLESRSLFGDPDHPDCRKLLERVFQAQEIRWIAISGTDSPRAELHYCPRTFSLKDVVNIVTSLLATKPGCRQFAVIPVPCSRLASSRVKRMLQSLERP